MTQQMRIPPQKKCRWKIPAAPKVFLWIKLPEVFPLEDEKVKFISDVN